MSKIGKMYFKDSTNFQINLFNVILIQIAADIFYRNCEACYKILWKFKCPNNQNNLKNKSESTFWFHNIVAIHSNQDCGYDIRKDIWIYKAEGRVLIPIIPCRINWFSRCQKYPKDSVLNKSLRQLDIQCQRMNLNTYLTMYKQAISEYIIYLNVSAKIIILSEILYSELGLHLL